MNFTGCCPLHTIFNLQLCSQDCFACFFLTLLITEVQIYLGSSKDPRRDNRVLLQPTWCQRVKSGFAICCLLFYCLFALRKSEILYGLNCHEYEGKPFAWVLSLMKKWRYIICRSRSSRRKRFIDMHQSRNFKS